MSVTPSRFTCAQTHNSDAVHEAHRPSGPMWPGPTARSCRDRDRIVTRPRTSTAEGSQDGRTLPRPPGPRYTPSLAPPLPGSAGKHANGQLLAAQEVRGDLPQISGGPGGVLGG